MSTIIKNIYYFIFPAGVPLNKTKFKVLALK